VHVRAGSLTANPLDGGLHPAPPPREVHISPDAATVARELLAAWNARDFERFLGLLADDVEWYDPGMARPPARGRDQVRAFVDTVLHAFPDFRCDVREPICMAPDGTRCAIPWHITATHTAPLVPPGFAPTGRQFCQDGIDLLEVRAGRVARIQTYFDPIAAAEQLLAVTLRPPSGTVRERLLVFFQRLMAVRARRLTGA
jgi:steroid delta-isomerase-like uncharacterized protein